jgi:hypothetical protein
LHKDGSGRVVRTPVIVQNSGIHEAMSDCQFMDAYDAAEELSCWLRNLTTSIAGQSPIHARIIWRYPSAIHAFNPKWEEMNTFLQNYLSHERAALYGDIQTAAMGRNDFEMLDGASLTYGRDDLNRPGDPVHYTTPLYRQWTSQLLTALCSTECLPAWKRGSPSHSRH